MIMRSFERSFVHSSMFAHFTKYKCLFFVDYFYAVTISTTLISLLKSLLVWSLIRRRITTALPRKLPLVIKRVGHLLIGNFKEITVQKSTSESNKFEAVKIARREEWKKVFIIFHALSSLILVSTYIAYVLFIFNSF